MIGNTPMRELTKLDAGPCRLFVKLENQNPAGSIKDRIGLAMIEAAEKDGRLRPGGTIVETTAGNTGLGLALVAAQKGRSEEHTSELQSLMRISYAVFCLQKKKQQHIHNTKKHKEKKQS